MYLENNNASEYIVLKIYSLFAVNHLVRIYMKWECNTFSWALYITNIIIIIIMLYSKKVAHSVLHCSPMRPSINCYNCYTIITINTYRQVFLLNNYVEFFYNKTNILYVNKLNTLMLRATQTNVKHMRVWSSVGTLLTLCVYSVGIYKFM